MTDITIVSVSKNNESRSILHKSIFDECGAPRYGFHTVGMVERNNNDQNLSKIYNYHLNTEVDSKYVIFCHDDVSIEDSNLYGKIDKAIGDDSEYAICGVAGNTMCRVQEKNLWHIMGNKDTMSGAVAHYTGKDDTECFMTNFGPTPKRVVLLDGLFLAVNLKKINDFGLRFDEDYPSKFNFYDLDFSLQANKMGLKMTTWPIWLVHKSHGLSDINNEDWNKGNEYFKKKWGK